jgi:demethylmenaquinone methyltransferase/2-methoxy-6-polyprenyl-1,4-benzoquinol methylase
MSLKPMFAKVVKRYDLLNRILTLGFDLSWRNICASYCTSGKDVLDLCCGTGDLALSISKNTAPGTFVLGLDFSKMMLHRAKIKTHLEWQRKTHNNIKQKKRGGINTNVDFFLADASCLPFRNDSINRICISFSFRNLIYKNPQAKLFLMEVLRTLRPQGKFVIVETSQPKSLFIRILFHLYLNIIVPNIGWLISGNKGAYRYLGLSAKNFPSAKKVANLLLTAGFRKVLFKHLTFGIVSLHVGVK